MSEFASINSITQVHEFMGLKKPKHPLVSVIHAREIHLVQMPINTPFVFNLFHISMKDGIEGRLGYGRNYYDFEEGTMIFTSPGQVITVEDPTHGEHSSGWSLIFHPDLIRGMRLSDSISQYSFFSYDIHESLHLSEEEKNTLTEIIGKIEKEFQYIIDRHSQKLIVSNIELLLNYCTRYYDRQFYTRANVNRDVLSRFEALLIDYYQEGDQLVRGIPTVNYCGNQLNVSPKYLSDLLKKETGKNAKSHIDDFLINKAKNMLLGSLDSISEIAFELGFEYSQHFSKVFKAKTGMSPSQYRSQN